jgi:hypothetical protein
VPPAARRKQLNAVATEDVTGQTNAQSANRFEDQVRDEINTRDNDMAHGGEDQE